MKTILTTALLGLVLMGMNASAQTAPSLVSKNWSIADVPLRIEGRSARGDQGSLRLGFPGVTLHLRFHGSALSLHVNATTDEVYFNIFVDGAAPVRLRAHKGEGVYPLLASASAADHFIEVVRRSESWQGTCEILGFVSADADRFLAAEPAPARRLQFIGDSITCGSSVDTNADDPLNGKTHDGSHTSNASKSFGLLLAKRLKADCHLVSYGGRGVIRDWQGGKETANAPQFYELALPDDPTAKWDQSSYIPDAIGICLGTNDFSQGIPDQNDFINSFVQFLQKVRRDSPHAYIWLIQSPILDDAAGKMPKRSVAAAYLREIVLRMHDSRIAYASLPHYPGVPNDGHPTAADHVSMTNELEPLFRQALQW